MKQRSKVPVRQRVMWAVNDDVMTSATARDETGRRLLTQGTRRTCYHLPIIMLLIMIIDARKEDAVQFCSATCAYQ